MSSVRTQLNWYMFLSGYAVTLMTLPVKTPPDILLHDSHTAVRLWLLLDNSWVTRPSFSLLWSSSSSHLPSIRLPLHSRPLSFPSPFLFSSIHYQEGQPVEAPVSPTPSQQALEVEAAAAATVSDLKATNHHIWFEEVANSAAELFLTRLRTWDTRTLGKCPCYSLRWCQKRFPPLRNRFWDHLYHWSAKCHSAM